MRTPGMFFLASAVVVVLVGCGADGGNVPVVSSGCVVTLVPEGYRLQCPGQAPVTIVNGTDGADGADGSNGADGANGADGRDGVDGSNGHSSLIAQLPAGSECAEGGVTLLTSLDVNDNLVVDAGDSHLQSATICNGNSASLAPFTPIALVDPCGTAPGIHNEVFFRLANGSLVASFSDSANGANTRFSQLAAGTYVTTDGDQCYFTVTADFQITNEHH